MQMELLPDYMFEEIETKIPIPRNPYCDYKAEMYETEKAFQYNIEKEE